MTKKTRYHKRGVADPKTLKGEGRMIPESSHHFFVESHLFAGNQVVGDTDHLK